ncbi:MAG: hypothetical protein CL587_20905 [Alteromonadaceae bacterium]|nr:hypothetical protein [Alteromonadaceae bacterium]
MSTPLLRYPQFDGDWEQVKVGDVSKVTSGGTPNRTNLNYWGGKIPWVTTSLINFNTINDAEEYITDEGLTNSSAKLFPKGTLLIALYGQGVTRGKVALLGLEAATNQACAAILFVRSKVDQNFAFFQLMSKYYAIRNLANDGGQKNLSGGLIKSLGLALPSIDEQLKIANFLSSVDRKISLLKEKLALLLQYKKGVLQKLFSQEISFKDESGDEFSDWQEYKLSDVLELTLSPIKMEDESEYELITVRRRNGGVNSRGFYKGKEVLVKSQFELKKNQFIISKRQIVHGACGVVPSDLEGAIVSNEYNVFDVVPGLLDVHFFNLFSQTKYMRRAYFINSDGVHIEKLLFKTQSWLKTKVTIPSLSEQKKIVAFVRALDEKLVAINKKIELTQIYKKGLLQQMFV